MVLDEGRSIADSARATGHLGGWELLQVASLGGGRLRWSDRGEVDADEFVHEDDDRPDFAALSVGADIGDQEYRGV